MLMFVLLIFPNKTQSKPQNEVSIKTNLEYQISDDGLTYNLDVQIFKHADGSYTLEWKSGKPKNQRGSVALTNTALEKAIALNFNFPNNLKETETSLLISHKMFASWENNIICNITLNNKSKYAFSNANKHTQNIVYNQESYHEVTCKTVTDDYGNAITYMYNEQFPIILQLNCDGFSVYLKKIETGE